MKHFYQILSLSTFLLFAFSINTASAQTVETLVAGPSTFDDGLAIDKEGNIYASRYFGTTVTKITLDGETSIFASELTNPNGITFDSDGNLYIPNAKANRIDKVDTEGVKTTFLDSITNPTGLLFLDDGSLLIAQYDLSRISKRATDGAVTTYLSGNGLNGPVGLQMDEAGNLYIGNFNNGKVFKRTPEGTMTEIGDLPGWLGFITYANGFVYATAYQGHQVYKINTNGSGQEVFAGSGSAGSSNGDAKTASFNQPNGIAASATGDTLFVSDLFTRSLRMIIGVNPVSTNSEIEKDGARGFNLKQNYPNPFNPSTLIQFNLSKTERISLDVFDLKGRKVADLANSVYTQGEHSVIFNASNLSSGIYYYALKSGDKVQTRKMTLIK